MNKVFKLVYNRARQTTMIVNEKTSSVQSGKKAAVTVAVAGALMAFSGMSLAASHELTAPETLTGQQNNAYLNKSELTVTKATFEKLGNNDANGGAIWNTTGGTTAVTQSQFVGNVASIGGAIGNGLGGVSVSIDGSTFTNNHASDGGAVASFKKLTITNSVFEGNTAQKTLEGEQWTGQSIDDNPVGGGAVSLGSEATATITGATFKNNLSGFNGGAIATRMAVNKKGTGSANNHADASLDVNATFEGNHSDVDGGALFNSFYQGNTAHGEGVTVTGQFIKNSAGGSGGAIYNDRHQDTNKKAAVMTVYGNTLFSGNHSENFGGAIFNGGTLTVDGATFSDNTAKAVGGAISNGTKSVMTTVKNATFTNNHSSDGGAIGNYSHLVVENAYFEGNTAQLGELLVPEGTSFQDNKLNRSSACCLFSFDASPDTAGRAFGSASLMPSSTSNIRLQA